MKTKDLEYFGISRQLKSEWKKQNNSKYRIILLLESININEAKKIVNREETNLYNILEKNNFDSIIQKSTQI